MHVNGIWHKGSELIDASTRKLILYFAGGGSIPYVGWNNPELRMISSNNDSWWIYGDVQKWCYVDDLLSLEAKLAELKGRE